MLDDRDSPGVVIPARRALLLLILLTVVSLYWFVDAYFEPMWDAVLYLLTTRSLIAGDGYAVFGDAFTLRPPGFSLLLAPVMAVFGTDFLVLNLFVSLLGILAIALIFVFFHRRLGSAVAFALCVTLWISPQYQGLCNVALSDTVGLAAVIGCLLLDRWAAEHRSVRRDILLGIAIGCSLYLRSSCLLLVPAIALSRLINRRTVAGAQSAGKQGVRIALLLAVPLLVQTPWTIWKHQHPAPVPPEVNGIYSYETAQWQADPADPDSARLPLSAVLARVPERFEQCFTSLGSRLPKLPIHLQASNQEFKRARAENVKPFGFWFGCVGVLSLIVVCIRRRDAASFFALGSLALLLIYFDFDDRLLVPTYVFVLGAVLELIHLPLRRLMSAGPARGVAASLVMLMGISDASPANDRSAIVAQNLTNTKVAEWVDDHYPQDVAVGGSLGHRLAGFFDRPIYFLEIAARGKGPGRVRAVLAKHDLQLFIHTGPNASAWTRSMEPFLRNSARLVHQIDDVKIYELPSLSP